MKPSSSALLPVLLLVLAPALSGCIGCDSGLLEVRHCLEGQRACDPDSDRIVDWNVAHGVRFPEVDALLQAVAVGAHGHADYTAQQEAEFWAYWGDEVHDDQIFFRTDDGVYRVRIHSCE